MGRPPVPMEDSTRIARARGVVRNAEAAEQAASAANQSASAAKKLPKVVSNSRAVIAQEVGEVWHRGHGTHVDTLWAIT